MLDASALKSSCCLSVDGIRDLRCLAFVYMVCWLFAVLVVGCPLPVPCWMLQKKIKGLKGVRWERCVCGERSLKLCRNVSMRRFENDVIKLHCECIPKVQHR